MFIINIRDAIKKTRRLRTLSENTMTHGYQIWGFKAELVMRIHLLLGSWMLKIWGVMEVPEWFVLVLQLMYDLCDLYCIIVYILWTSVAAICILYVFVAEKKGGINVRSLETQNILFLTFSFNTNTLPIFLFMFFIELRETIKITKKLWILSKATRPLPLGWYGH